jgi:cytochrome c556
MTHKSISLRLGISVAASAFLLAGCSAPAEPPAPAPVAEAMPAVPPPQVSINAEMVMLVDHAAHQLWDTEKEGMAPKTDADWIEIEEHATQLAAAGNLIMLGGGGPNDLVWNKSPEWRTHALAMSSAGMAAVTAAQQKNFTALVAANGQLVDACEGCHKEFKPELPSEGITHEHTHPN